MKYVIILKNYIFLILKSKIEVEMALIEIVKTSKNEKKDGGNKHKRKYYELNAFIEGSGIFYANKTSYLVNKNCVAIFSPKDSFTITGGPFVRYSISVFPQILTKFEEEVLKLFSSKPVIELPQKIFSRLLEVAKNMHELKHTTKHREEILHILFSLFLLELYKCIINKSSSSPDQSSVPPMVYSIINYVKENYGKKLSLEIIAKNLNYSVPNIRKNFKKYMGISISEYILNYRLDQVKNLLTTTSKSMNKIAEECGFSSANYLSLIFREKESLSPLAYRKIKKS